MEVPLLVVAQGEVVEGPRAVAAHDVARPELRGAPADQGPTRRQPPVHDGAGQQVERNDDQADADGEEADRCEAVDRGGEADPAHSHQALGRTGQDTGPRGERVVAHPAGHLDGDEAAERGDDASEGQDHERGEHRGPLRLRPEQLALDQEEDEHGGAHEQRDDVGVVGEMQQQRHAEQGDGDEPGAALALEDPARQHDHADAGDGTERPCRLDHRDRQVLGDELQVLAQRFGDGRQELDRPGDEERDGRDPPDATHPDAVGGDLGRGRPRRPARPAGRQLGVHVGGAGPALDHTVGRHEALAQRGQREVHLGQHEPHVQVRSGLQLEGRLLAVVQERGGEAQSAAVLAHHLRGRTGAGEETPLQVGQLGDQRTADDDAGGPGRDRLARRVQRVVAVEREQRVGDRAHARGPAGPRSRETLATEGAPDAA